MLAGKNEARPDSTKNEKSGQASIGWYCDHARTRYAIVKATAIGADQQRHEARPDGEQRDRANERALKGAPRVERRPVFTDHARRTFELVEGLLRRGWREDHVELVLAGNFRRALGEIWAPAAPPAPLCA